MQKKGAALSKERQLESDDARTGLGSYPTECSTHKRYKANVCLQE